MNRVLARKILAILVIGGFYGTPVAVGVMFGLGAMVSVLLIITAVGWIVTMITMAGERKRRLRMVGRCVCGYDLRATPDRCPECGRFPQRRRPWYTLSS